jgi:hypothetical protein
MKNFCLIICLFFLAACGREGLNHQRCAGAWTITEVRGEYYTGGTLDSTIQDTRLGTLLLFDNGSANGNILDYKFTKPLPRSLQLLMNNSTDWFWYTDPYSRNRITFVSVEGYFEAYHIYTLTEHKRKKMVLQYTEEDGSNSSQLKYKETLTLERE